MYRRDYSAKNTDGNSSFIQYHREHDTIVNTHNFGFPDVMFNSFPGIGAYTFLSRKVGMPIAERMILGGKLYSAEELFNLGIVDVLASPLVINT